MKKYVHTIISREEQLRQSFTIGRFDIIDRYKSIKNVIMTVLLMMTIVNSSLIGMLWGLGLLAKAGNLLLGISCIAGGLLIIIAAVMIMHTKASFSLYKVIDVAESVLHYLYIIEFELLYFPWCFLRDMRARSPIVPAESKKPATV